MAVQTADDRSISELVQRLSTQTGDLVRQELRLADVKEQIREHSPDARRLGGIAAAVVAAFTLLVILRKRRR